MTAINEHGDGENALSRDRTDADGRAFLPPLRPGTVQLRVEARDHQAHVGERLPVRESDGRRELTVRLAPLGATREVRVVLPTGSPAAGAEACLLPSTAADPVWFGRADHRGILTLPERPAAALLLVRHPAAAFAVRTLSGASGRLTLALPPAAPPLRLRLPHGGGEPAPWAKLALETGGLPLAGGALAWLTGRPSAGADGTWTLANLPLAPVRLLAWTAPRPPGEMLPFLANLAHEVAPPWPAVTTVEVLE